MFAKLSFCLEDLITVVEMTLSYNDQPDLMVDRYLYICEPPLASAFRFLHKPYYVMCMAFSKFVYVVFCKRSGAMLDAPSVCIV